MKVLFIFRGENQRRRNGPGQTGYDGIINATDCVANWKATLFDDLRSNNIDYDVAFITYPSPILGELVEKVRPIKVITNGPVQQIGHLTTACQIAEQEKQHYDRVVILRFDFQYRLPITKWPKWDSKGIILANKDVYWNQNKCYHDIVFITDTSCLEVFIEAVKNSMVDGMYRNKIGQYMYHHKVPFNLMYEDGYHMIGHPLYALKHFEKDPDLEHPDPGAVVTRASDFKTVSRGKVGIFAPCQVGDIMTAMSVFKYHEQLWPDKDVVWFCDDKAPQNYADALKFSPVSEIRTYSGEHLAMKTNSGVGAGMNRLDITKAKSLPSTADLEIGYFPLPWMLERAEQRAGMTLPQVSQRIFGVQDSQPWRPRLYFSDEERKMVAEKMAALPHPKTVMFENSPCAYSEWNDGLTRMAMSMCRKKWGRVNFFFASGGNRSGNDMSRFFDDPGCVSGSSLTARQIALANDYCNLFVGVAGALTFATSCWGAKPVPKLIYTGSETFGARGIANGRIEIVAMDGCGHNKSIAERSFEMKLAALLEIA